MPRCVQGEFKHPLEARLNEPLRIPRKVNMPKKLTQEQAMEGTVRFSEKYVEKSGYKFFPDEEVVRLVQEGLATNQVEQGYRYCP